MPATRGNNSRKGKNNKKIKSHEESTECENVNSNHARMVEGQDLDSELSDGNKRAKSDKRKILKTTCKDQDEFTAQIVEFQEEEDMIQMEVDAEEFESENDPSDSESEPGQVSDSEVEGNYDSQDYDTGKEHSRTTSDGESEDDQLPENKR